MCYFFNSDKVYNRALSVKKLKKYNFYSIEGDIVFALFPSLMNVFREREN